MFMMMMMEVTMFIMMVMMVKMMKMMDTKSRVVFVNLEEDDEDSWLTRCDSALYRAKSEGRNTVCRSDGC